MYSAISTALVVICSVLVPFSSVFVALRFKARKRTIAGLGLDDYTILVVQVLQYAGAAATIFSVVAGGNGDSGRNLVEHPSEMATYAKIQYMGPILFAAIVALVKVSTLILYKRIFVTKRFHLACHVMMALTVGWFLTSIFGEVFSSNPVSNGPKDPYGPFVLNYPLFLVSMAVSNMILDVIVVCMPLSVIRTLQMSSARKVQVSGIFLLGLFCDVAAAVRVYYIQLINNAGTSRSGPESNKIDKILAASAHTFIWFVVEAQTSVIAACLPTLAPLLHNSPHVAVKVQNWCSRLSLYPRRPEAITKSTNNKATDIEQGNKHDRRPWQHLGSDTSQKGDITDDSNVEMRPLDVV